MMVDSNQCLWRLPAAVPFQLPYEVTSRGVEWQIGQHVEAAVTRFYLWGVGLLLLTSVGLTVATVVLIESTEMIIILAGLFFLPVAAMSGAVVVYLVRHVRHIPSSGRVVLPRKTGSIIYAPILLVGPFSLNLKALIVPLRDGGVVVCCDWSGSVVDEYERKLIQAAEIQVQKRVEPIQMAGYISVRAVGVAIKRVLRR
jgi:hypothetical protein